MTTDEIIEKYPKIFQDYEGNPGRVNWYGVPNGWLPIIDKLCSCIQSYCNSTMTVPNPDYIEGSQWDPKDITTQRYMCEPRPQVRCVQMKEKFGGLRFYTNMHDDRVQGMIDMAETLAANTCESCSTEEDLGYTSGWITVKCKKCADEAGAKWTSKEDYKKKQEEWRAKDQTRNK